MTFGERVKAVRKSSNLTQEAFASRLGLKQNSVALIESEKRNASDQVVLSICREFGIRESWLRFGEGEMKAEGNRAEEVKTQVERLFADDTAEFQQALISALLQFDPRGPQWRVVEEIFQNVSARLAGTPPAEAAHRAGTPAGCRKKGQFSLMAERLRRHQPFRG